MKKKRGFTLIEMLVVIAIIGILATVLAPKMREQLAKAKDAKVIATLGVFRTGTQISIIDSEIADSTERRGNKVLVKGKDIEAKMNNKSLDILNDGKLIVGGFRQNKDSRLELNKEMAFVFVNERNTKNNKMADKRKGKFYSTDGEYFVDEDTEIIITTPNQYSRGYSSEGKKWSKY